MTETVPSVVGHGRSAGISPAAAVSPQVGKPVIAEVHRHPAACWALDVSRARPVIASVAGGMSGPDWAVSLLAEIRIADVNQLTVHLVGSYAGYDRMIGQPVTAFWPPESRPVLAELIMAAVADYPLRAPRTRKVTSVAFSDPVLTVWTAADEGNPDILLLSITGTAADDRSLWSLRVSEERYRNLILHLPCALLQVDSRPMLPIFDQLRRDGITDLGACLDERPELISLAKNLVRVTEVNHSAVRLFGVSSADQLIGPVEYLFAAAPESARRVMIGHFGGWRSHVETMKLRTFDGRLRDAELSVTYPVAPERLDVTLFAVQDMTDRLRTEAQLRQLEADFSRAARISTLGELATSIAHEVNQPLSAIVTNAETGLRWLSRADPNPAKLGQLTARIADSARHASDIVQRIRGMAAQRPPERALLDLDEIVEEALLFVRHDIESRSIELEIELGADLPAVLGDRVQLQQVMVNLFVNSVQAIAQSPESKGSYRSPHRRRRKRRGHLRYPR